MSEPNRCAHLRPELALIVAALDDSDPTRVAVLKHTAVCPSCRALLEEGKAMLQLLDSYEHECPVNPRLKTRILNSVADMPQRRRSIGWEHVALACGAALSAWLAWFDGHARTGLYPTHGPLCLLWELLGVALVLGPVAWIKHKAVWRSPTRIALTAMGGALLGQLWLRYRCPSHDATLHVLAFHVTGVLFIAFVGVAAELWSWRRSY